VFAGAVNVFGVKASWLACSVETVSVVPAPGEPAGDPAGDPAGELAGDPWGDDGAPEPAGEEGAPEPPGALLGPSGAYVQPALAPEPHATSANAAMNAHDPRAMSVNEFLCMAEFLPIAS
jgi:hypothetical protein